MSERKWNSIIPNVYSQDVLIEKSGRWNLSGWISGLERLRDRLVVLPREKVPKVSEALRANLF